MFGNKNVAGGLDRDALIDGRYDTRMFRLSPRFKSILAGGRNMQVRQATERRVVLPNGHVLKISADASGVATQIEDDEHQHAVVRAETYAVKLTRADHTPDGRDLSRVAQWARQRLYAHSRAGQRALRKEARHA
jgi:hypothetical protein